MIDYNAIAMTVVPVSTFLVMGCGALAIAGGNALHARSKVLRRALIPPPIVAGLLLAVATLVLRWAGWALDADNTVQQIAMMTFFTSIGFHLDREAVRQGGRPTVVILLMFGLGALVQNLVGVAIACWQGLHPLIGIAAGSVALAGGPATSLAFGPTLEEAGARGATSVALASAIVGILVAGTTAGAFGGFLIRRDGLFAGKDSIPDGPFVKEGMQSVDPAALLRTVILFSIAMGLGHLVNLILNRGLRGLSISLPAYIGAMIIAAFMRSGAARFPALKMAPAWNEAVGSAALSWYVPLALWTLRYWEVRGLAGPVLLILAAQLPTTIALAWLWTCPHF
jgi:ESS family glutamate:Na+ symporter